MVSLAGFGGTLARNESSAAGVIHIDQPGPSLSILNGSTSVSAERLKAPLWRPCASSLNSTVICLPLTE